MYVDHIGVWLGDSTKLILQEIYRTGGEFISFSPILLFVKKTKYEYILQEEFLYFFKILNLTHFL